MPSNAFTSGVKPGGLTSSSEVRMLLCYLIKTAAPLTRQNMEQALLSEQLVNYFELAASLSDLEAQGLATVDAAGVYSITPKGAAVTDELGFDLLPRSVRETAVRAALRAQQWVRKAAQHKAEIEKSGEGYTVRCSISELGQPVFSMALSLPDPFTAEMVKTAFVEKGDALYALVLNALTEHSGET